MQELIQIAKVKLGQINYASVGIGTVPRIPTVTESGIAGFDYVTWFAFFAPARTPQDIIAKLTVEIVRILATPELAQ